MTDRVKGLIIALAEDVREDDIEGLMVAIQHLRGVSSVTTSVSTPDDWINRQQIKAEIRKKLWGVLMDDEP
jgi:hypothetical protein